MSSYKKIKAQIARLQREAEDARKAEAAVVAEKLRKSIALYGLTAADLGLDGDSQPAPRARLVSRKAPAKKSAPPGAGVAKYRNPKSGATWSGFGRAPNWLASVKDREAFRIGEEAAQPAAVAQPDAPVGSAPKTARKTGAKTASKKTTKKAAANGAAAAKPPPTKKRSGAKAAAKTSGPSADALSAEDAGKDASAPASSVAEAAPI